MSDRLTAWAMGVQAQADFDQFVVILRTKHSVVSHGPFDSPREATQWANTVTSEDTQHGVEYLDVIVTPLLSIDMKESD